MLVFFLISLGIVNFRCRGFFWVLEFSGMGVNELGEVEMVVVYGYWVFFSFLSVIVSY